MPRHLLAVREVSWSRHRLQAAASRVAPPVSRATEGRPFKLHKQGHKGPAWVGRLQQAPETKAGARTPAAANSRHSSVVRCMLQTTAPTQKRRALKAPSACTNCRNRFHKNHNRFRTLCAPSFSCVQRGVWRGQFLCGPPPRPCIIGVSGSSLHSQPVRVP